MELISRGTAVISDCGCYRPWLTRDLGGEAPLVCIGANPSTADADLDDPTMRKDQGFARRWGCGSLIKVNIYPWRATKPKDMWAARKAGADILGVAMSIGGKPESNLLYLMRAMQRVQDIGGVVLAAWGNIPEIEDVIATIGELARAYPDVPIECLGTNGNGSPKHTLYLSSAAERQPWRLP